jgi:hypothetical protein
MGKTDNESELMGICKLNVECADWSWEWYTFSRGIIPSLLEIKGG